MAKKKSEGLVEVRVLVAGTYGDVEAKIDDVLELPQDVADAHAAAYAVDPDPAAVEYAKLLQASAAAD